MKKYTVEELRSSMVVMNPHKIHYDKNPKLRYYEHMRKYYLLKTKYYKIRRSLEGEIS